MSLPVRLSTLRALIKEIEVSAAADEPLVVGGPPALAQALRRELMAGSVGGKAADARPEKPPAFGGLGVSGGDDPRHAAVYVHIWAGHDDEAQLKRARRARTPIVALVPEEVDDVPYVLATDVVRLRPGHGFPIEALAKAIAGRLGEEGAPLAARVPALRRAVAEELIASFARRNALIGAAVFIPGLDLPVLLRNELRLVLRLHQVYGHEAGPRARLPEIGVTAAAGFGLRAVARELLDLVPVAGWAVKGAVAYAGTRALGQATLRRLGSVELNGTPGGH